MPGRMNPFAHPIRYWRPDHGADRIPALDLFTLRFRDDAFEAAYRAERRPGYVTQLRIGLLVGLILYSLYGPLDAFLVRADVWTVWLVRYGVTVPVVFGCIALSWHAFFYRNPQLLLTLTMQLVGASIISQMVILPIPGTSYYFSGLITALYFTCCVLRPHPTWAAMNCILFGLGYIGFAGFLERVDSTWLLNNAGFLAADSIVAVFATYMFELRLRQIHARDQILAEQLERTEDLRQKAEQANVLKSRFVATASHELRTPLNAIVGFSEIMANERFGPLGNSHYRDYASTIHDSGTRLMTTVNDLLDVSKAQTNTLEIAREELDLNEVLRRAVKEVRPQADDKGLHIRLTETKDPLVVEADPRLLRRASANLLANAVKFTDEGGVDVIARRPAAGGACIDVIDTGPGIPAAEQSQIFDSFVHGDSAYRRRARGAGLGLALVQQIARMHGGNVALASVPGAGTRFTLALPEAADPAAAA